MCACNNKQMYTIRKMAKEIDPKAFIVIMESNDVVGEGFKENQTKKKIYLHPKMDEVCKKERTHCK